MNSVEARRVMAVLDDSLDSLRYSAAGVPKNAAAVQSTIILYAGCFHTSRKRHSLAQTSCLA